MRFFFACHSWHTVSPFNIFISIRQKKTYLSSSAFHENHIRIFMFNRRKKNISLHTESIRRFTFLSRSLLRFIAHIHRIIKIYLLHWSFRCCPFFFFIFSFQFDKFDQSNSLLNSASLSHNKHQWCHVNLNMQCDLCLWLL